MMTPREIAEKIFNEHHAHSDKSQCIDEIESIIAAAIKEAYEECAKIAEVYLGKFTPAPTRFEAVELGKRIREHSQNVIRGDE